MSEKTYLFTSESVSSGHPDKLADQISDAVLDEFLRQDPNSKVACETFITDGLVVVGGEAHSDAYVDIKAVAKKVLNDVGYTPESCFDPNNFGLINTLHEQSSDIRQGVDREEGEQGAGDQGIMFGYACTETYSYMPATLVLAHTTLQVLEEVRKSKYSKAIYPDSKSQYTIEYDRETNKPLGIKTILVSTQHAEQVSIGDIRDILTEIVLPEVKDRLPELAYLFDTDYELLVNPTGRFVIGGPKGDTGLSNRKIIVDSYGGRAPHGGGGYSGKESSKVDRSGAYMARYIAKNVVVAGLASECTVEISYAIGMADPLSVYVNTNNTSTVEGGDYAIEEAVKSIFDMKPASIIKTLGLKNPIYLPTATYGHFGKVPYYDENGVMYFGWERIDKANDLRKHFGLKSYPMIKNEW